MKKIFFISILILIFYFNSLSQEIRIDAIDKPLNEILIEVRNNYNLNLSFNDSELSQYQITLHKTFSSPGSAFQHLLNDLPIAFKKSGKVYLFFPKPKNVKSYRLSGKVIDTENMESLPFSHVLINGSGQITDEFGNFNFRSEKDSIFNLKISYLGYQIQDTILKPGLNHKINLKSASISLNEVVIKSNPLISTEQTGSEAGLMRINHKIALLIPGNGDNSVFNILRLQPGILAAGEQSSELIIWGSYEGQSQVSFDKMTLFGLKNYNDNISAVNPYIAKDIRIHKGGFDATLGERIGGIVDITGIEGNKNNPGLNFNLNNMTMNILAETPLGNRMSIVGAYRQTYYNLYSQEDIQLVESTQSHFADNGIITNPDYQFRDGNLKLSGQTSNGDSYYVSSFWGQDQFFYSVEQSHNNSILTQELKEQNQQYGISALYNKLWKGKGSSEISIAYSSLQTNKKDMQNSSEVMMNHNMHSQDANIQNDISELKAIVSGNLRLKQRHKIEFGIGLINNSTILKESLFDNITTNNIDQGSQILAYFQEQFSLNKKTNITAGVRSDYSVNLDKFFVQPRLNIVFKPTSKLQLNASWGIYNQFVMLSSIVDQYSNYSYLWRISDGNQIPVLSSQHTVIGGIYRQKGFSMSIEGFYKESSGITRILQSDAQTTLFEGKNKTKGIDFFIKQDYKGHSIWMSYSISQSLERFPFFQDNDYKSAIHDQRHEIKFSGILNLSPFFISANYVYGSGFLQNTSLISDETKRYPYKRIDISGIYRFSLKRMKLETGFSILNLLNHENIKFTDITQIPTDNDNTVNIYSEAVPFTPTIFLNFSF
ncbi:MAG: TonB-dependent receptor [Bacteroidales bacterium]|nr:TonB-dependent receptor [Bacteroidales bacterium]